MRDSHRRVKESGGNCREKPYQLLSTLVSGRNATEYRFSQPGYPVSLQALGRDVSRSSYFQLAPGLLAQPGTSPYPNVRYCASVLNSITAKSLKSLNPRSRVSPPRNVSEGPLSSSRMREVRIQPVPLALASEGLRPFSPKNLGFFRPDVHASWRVDETVFLTTANHRWKETYHLLRFLYTKTAPHRIVSC